MKPSLLGLPRQARRDREPAPPIAAPSSGPPTRGARGQRFLQFQERKKMVVDEERRTVEVSFSSEEPVAQWWGMEILDHSPKAVDLSRLKSAGPVLMDHDRRDQVGVIEKVWLEDKVGRALLRFGSGARAKEVWQDVLDGIRRNVSVSYDIEDAVLESQTEGVNTYRIKSWCPSEISIVSVPADTTVGVGRSVPPPTQPPQIAMNRAQIIALLQRHGIQFDNNSTDEQLRTLLETNFSQRAPTVPITPPPPPVVLNEPQITARAMQLERERITGIQSLYVAHRGAEIDKDGKILEGFLGDGAKSVQDMQRWLLENRYKATPVILDPNIGMSDKEVRSYSLIRAINLLADGKPLDGLEKEASDTVAKRNKRQARGFFVPHDVAIRSLAEAKGLSKDDILRLALNQRALTAGVASAGGYTVGTEVLTGSLIELLRNKALVMQLGARSLTGLVGDISIPRHSGGATTYWLDETGSVTLSQQTFGQLALTPHRLAAATAYSKQLLVQSSIDIEAFVRGDLMRVLAIEKDRAALNGINAAGEPLGILNTTGIGSVTFGAAATWAKLLDFETQVANANADVGSLAYMTTPNSRAKWKAATKIAASQYSDFLWEKGGAPGEGIVNSYRAVATLQVPSNRVIFGNWADYILADWDGIDITVDPYSLVTSGQIQIVVMLLTDNGMRHVGSFCASSDSGAQ